VITVVPYALLAVLTLVTVIIKWSAGTSLVIDLGLCAAAAVWTLGMFTLRPAWRDRPTVMLVFFAVLIAIIAVLVFRDPWFGFFTPAGYFYAFRLLRRPWLLVGVAAVAMVAGTAQASSVDKSTAFGIAGYVAVLAVNVLPMCGYAWYAWRGARRNEQREQALRDVGEANRKLAATLADNATLQQRLLDQAREAGMLDERQRMAREIHDTLAQGLTGIITQLQVVELAADDPVEWRRHVTAATRLARESLAEARRSVHALRPEPLATARLGEALADVAGRWSALHRITVEVTTTGTARPMPPDAEAALLRTAQEALANVAKHARASRVGVTLSYMAHEVALDVRDDGRGFDPTQLAPPATDGGFGLVAMRQRIEGLSGTLQVESEPDVGTAISARIPAVLAGVAG
jgi:signal transduction histidine kinase